MPKVYVRHIGSGEYIITKIEDHNKTLPSWIKKDLDGSSGYMISLSDQFNFTLVSDE